MRVMGDDGIKIFVFIASLHMWHLKGHAMHPEYFRLPQVNSQVQPLKYLRMMRSNLMLVFSGTVLSCCTRKNTHVMYFIQYYSCCDVFTEILIYRLRSSSVKGGKGE